MLGGKGVGVAFEHDVGVAAPVPESLEFGHKLPPPLHRAKISAQFFEAVLPLDHAMGGETIHHIIAREQGGFPRLHLHSAETAPYRTRVRIPHDKMGREPERLLLPTVHEDGPALAHQAGALPAALRRMARLRLALARWASTGVLPFCMFSTILAILQGACW